MPKIKQHWQELVRVLTELLDLPPQQDIRGRIAPRSIYDFAITAPNYLKFLCAAYSLSPRQLGNVYRFGIGQKLKKTHSDIYNDPPEPIEAAKIEKCGILCPKGILMFYEDVFLEKRGQIRILAASYHFQTVYLNNSNPLYIRFEFDPTDFKTKPIFHYHFSDYETFEGCHFPAGHFQMDNIYPFGNQELLKSLSTPPPILNLEGFLRLLAENNLIDGVRN